MYMNKTTGRLLLILFCVVAMSSLVLAVPVTIDKVKLDGDEIYDTGTNSIRGIDRGDEFEIRVEVTSTSKAFDVQVEAELSGVHNEDVRDKTDTFDMKENTTYVKKLKLKFPDRMDQDTYRLRIRVEDRDGDSESEDYTLEIDTPRNLVIIKDVVFSPENEVKSGRSLLATVRIKNMGEKSEDGIKVSVSIPALGVSAGLDRRTHSYRRPEIRADVDWDQCPVTDS